MTKPKPPFKFSARTRVGFSDTDAQGVVYYGRYMPYFDLARVEYHRALDQLVTDPGRRQFVMRAMNVEYHAPAGFDDEIEVFVRIARIGTSSVTYEFCAYLVDGERLAVTATQTLVLVDLGERKSTRSPRGGRRRCAPSKAATSPDRKRETAPSGAVSAVAQPRDKCRAPSPLPWDGAAAPWALPPLPRSPSPVLHVVGARPGSCHPSFEVPRRPTR